MNVANKNKVDRESYYYDTLVGVVGAVERDLEVSDGTNVEISGRNGSK